MGTKTNKKRETGYLVFYIVAIACVTVIGFFGSSFFAYEFFNSLFFDLLCLILTVALFVVRSVQVYLRQTALYGKIFALIYYNTFAAVFAVRLFVSARMWAILLFGSLILALVLLIVLGFRCKKSQQGYRITRFEPLAAVIVMLLLLMLAALQSYLGEQGMWIPIVSAGAGLSAIALWVFLKFFGNSDYFRQEHRSERIFACILVSLTCFFFSAVTVMTINYAFDGNPTAYVCEIVDKRVQSGARQATSFLFEVRIDGKTKAVEVPAEVYHAKEIGDDIEIELYGGALGYAYYIFEYTESSEAT